MKPGPQESTASALCRAARQMRNACPTMANPRGYENGSGGSACQRVKCLMLESARRLVSGRLLLPPDPAPQAEAWNSTGHRLVAAIAYDRLTPNARARSTP